jgi:dTMP kinase
MPTNLGEEIANMQAAVVEGIKEAEQGIPLKPNATIVITKPTKPRFGHMFVIEGPDGSGKTTIAKMLHEYLSSKLPNRKVKMVREPGGTRAGEAIRGILLGPESPTSPTCELLLFMAARAEYMHSVINPKLIAGEILISDRFVDSTYAYQGYGDGQSIDLIDELHRKLKCLSVPTVTFILDVDPDIANMRLSKRTDVANHYDDKDVSFKQRVRCGYLCRAREPQHILIDANPPQDEVFKQIIKHVDKLMMVCGICN